MHARLLWSAAALLLAGTPAVAGDAYPAAKLLETTRAVVDEEIR